MKTSVYLGLVCISIVAVLSASCSSLSRSVSDSLYPDAINYFDCEKSVAITIDDGPSPHTHLIVDYLDSQQVPATFFLIGSNIEAFPQGVETILSSGRHELANHSYDIEHSKKVAELSAQRFAWGVQKTHELMRDHGFSSHWFRPGGGGYNEVILSCLDIGQTFDAEAVACTQELSAADEPLSYQLVVGDVYPFDHLIAWSGFHTWWIKRATTDGSVIVLHDFDQGRAQRSVQTLTKIVPHLRAEGYTFKTLTQMQACASGTE
jgi:peptidoglycan/xylan/chitin deacetylase (PgdA/CDA1 family)